MWPADACHPPRWPEGPRLELLSYCKTRHDPLLVQFSHLRPDTIYTVEQSITSSVRRRQKAFVMIV